MTSDLDFGVGLPNYVGNSMATGKVQTTFPIDYAFPMNNAFSWKQLVRISTDAEALGYDSIWASDHHMLGIGNYDAWVTLAALSPITKRLGLGTFVSCNNFRNPALVAKMAANLGSISGGRFVLGYGAGWYKPEYDAYGYEFPKPGTRVSMLKEGLEVIRGLLREKKFSFDGKYYHVKDAINQPKPRKKVPIMVGGGGKRTIGLAAEYADIWDVGADLSPESYRQKVEVLRRELKRVGRSFDSIKKSMHFRVLMGRDEEELGRRKREILRLVEGVASKLNFLPTPDFKFSIEETLIGTPRALRERLKTYAGLGCQQFILTFMDYPKFDSLEIFASALI